MPIRVAADIRRMNEEEFKARAYEVMGHGKHTAEGRSRLFPAKPVFGPAFTRLKPTATIRPFTRRGAAFWLAWRRAEEAWRLGVASSLARNR